MGDAWGLLVLDKPAGCSSHTAVQRVRRVLGVRRAGHAGTLDPLATGVLLVGLGRATRLLSHLVGHDKTYRARLRLGLIHDTLDREGRLVETRDVPDLQPAEVQAALARFTGTQRQVAPIFSAVKQGGEALHRKARRGEAVTPPTREVTLHQLRLLAWEPPDLVIEVHCSKGTYIRALARDLGEALGPGATLWELSRTRSGPFHLGQAVPLAEVEGLGGEAWRRVLPPKAMVPDLPRVSVTEREAEFLANGRPLRRASGVRGTVAVLGPTGELVAVGEQEDDTLRPDKVFRRAASTSMQEFE